MKLVHKALLLVCVPLAVQAGCYSLLFLKLDEADREREDEARKKTIVLEINSIYRNLISYSVGVTSNFLTRSGEYSTKISSAEDTLTKQYERIAELTKSDAKLSVEISDLRPVLDGFKNDCNQISDLVQSGKRMQAIMRIKGMRESIYELVDRLDNALTELRDSIVPLSHERQRRTVSTILGAGIAFDILMAVLTAFLVIKSWSNRIERLMDNTRRLTDGRPPESPMTGVDEIALLDQEFAKMSRTLEEVSKRKQELVSMVAHDLRTPLTSVRGTLSLLEAGAAGELSPPLLSEIQQADRSLVSVIALINELLSVEKARAGKLELNLDICNPASVIRKAVAAVDDFAKEHDLEFELDLLNDPVIADEERLTQAVTVIVSGACEKADSGAKIKIHSTKADGNLTTSIYCSQTSAESFKSTFTDTRSTTSLRIGKLDAGAAVSIIKQHGGTAGADTAPPPRIWFSIPLADESEEDSG